MPNTHSVDFSSFGLKRFPRAHHSSLRAWDTSDDYLTNLWQRLASVRVLLVNDTFGALYKGLEMSGCETLAMLTDSKLSALAYEQNLPANAPFFTLDEPLPFDPNLICFRLPKSLGMMASQLHYLASQITSPCTIVFSGMQKHVSKGHLQLMQSLCSDFELLPTVKKARAYQATLSPNAEALEPDAVVLEHVGVEVHNLGGVFCPKQIDIGSRFFIEHFDALPKSQKVADLGSGNGLLAFSYLKQVNAQARLHLFDESWDALRSAKAGAKANDVLEQCQFHWTHGLDQHKGFDLVLLNPPFHQQTTVTTDVAEELFASACKGLVPGGELWVVANRHLPYAKSLKKRFNTLETPFQNDKFVIYRATKKR